MEIPGFPALIGREADGIRLVSDFQIAGETPKAGRIQVLLKGSIP
jgi:hypothetical protein